MNTFSQIYIHLVFAVQGRQSLILPGWEEELYKYISGIIVGQGLKPLAINGMQDHLHIAFELKPSVRLSDVVREIKKSSHKFIKERKFLKFAFEWQDGYGAFSFNHKNKSAVISYIMNQKEHHKRRTFREEFLEFIDELNIEYNPKYLPQWIENDE